MKNKILLVLSVIIPGLLVLIKPFGMNTLQCMSTAVLFTVIFWWSTGLVKKIPACLVLLLAFSLMGSAPLEIIFTFPLSENFILIVISYLFSQGIVNSGLIDVFIHPFLRKYATTPLRIILLIAFIFFITIYMVPQPIARLILVASIFRDYLKTTDMKESAQEVIMFSIFSLFGLVNMFMRDSDLILNTSIVKFAGLNFSNTDWTKYMMVPSLGYLLIVIALTLVIFRKELGNDSVQCVKEIERKELSKVQKISAVILVLTVVLWMAASVFNFNITMITIISTLLLFFIKVLKLEDIQCIDVTTLVFLTAAFSIGGVMKSCGAADILFGQLKLLFPAEAGILYIFILITIGIAVHMILGSNTTTLSVIVPGFVMIASEHYPSEIVMMMAFICVAYHAVLPFHSIAMAIGAGNQYYPLKYITRYGLPAILLIYFAVFFLYLPWWRLIGVM